MQNFSAATAIHRVDGGPRGDLHLRGSPSAGLGRRLGRAAFAPLHPLWFNGFPPAPHAPCGHAWLSVGLPPGVVAAGSASPPSRLSKEGAVSEKDLVKFLGTAGARFVVARQMRYSAGTFLRLGGKAIMLDPGPGTLTRCAASRPRIDATKLDAVILTHSHIDHSNDVNILLDAMTAGGLEKRGHLFAPAECLEGPRKVLFDYLRDFPTRIVTLEAQSDYELDGVRFSTSVRHHHQAETYGVRFHRAPGAVSFLADTEYFDGLAESYAGSDVLVVNVVRLEPHKSVRIMHLTLADAERIIGEVRPRRAVLTHFGMTMLKAKPRELAARMSDRLGLEVIAARDGMTLQLDTEPS